MIFVKQSWFVIFQNLIFSLTVWNPSVYKAKYSCKCLLRMLALTPGFLHTCLETLLTASEDLQECCRVVHFYN